MTIIGITKGKKMTLILKNGPETPRYESEAGKGYIEIKDLHPKKTIATVLAGLKKLWPEFKNHDVLFYYNENFAVTPNTYVGDIYNGYANKEGKDRTLYLTYAFKEAWG